MRTRPTDPLTGKSPDYLGRAATASVTTDLEDDVKLFDTARVRRFAGHTFGAIRQFPLTAAAGGAAILALGSVSWLATPPSYQASGIISARNDVVSSAIANPRRSIPVGNDLPLANARQTILSQSNIDRIIDETGLVDHVDAGESALLKLRRLVLGSVGGTLTQEEQKDQIRHDLRLGLILSIDGGANGPDTLTITALWPHAEDAARIVDTAQRNFLQDRRTAALGPIEDAATILQRYSTDADERVAKLRTELAFPATDNRDIPVGSPLKAAVDQQADLTDRLRSAQIELDAAAAAFKYRYAVAQKAEVPTSPATSRLKPLAMTGVLVALAAGSAALARDSFRRSRGRDSSSTKTSSGRFRHAAQVDISSADTKEKGSAETDDPQNEGPETETDAPQYESWQIEAWQNVAHEMAPSPARTADDATPNQDGSTGSGRHPDFMASILS